MNPEKLQTILQKSTSHHSHLCPRQILGARLGLAGLAALGFEEPPARRRLLVITETDGCFVDGLIAATACTVGHRNLRVEDWGKTAATFVDTLTGQAIRVAPALDIRDRALLYAPEVPQHYFAQLQAYRIMPDNKMFTVTPVCLKTPLEAMISRPGMRVTCGVCGEEIMNERETVRDGINLCHACTGESYYFALPTFDEAKSFDLNETLA